LGSWFGWKKGETVRVERWSKESKKMMERTVSLSKTQFFIHKLITQCSHLHIFFGSYASWILVNKKKNKSLSCIGVGETNKEKIDQNQIQQNSQLMKNKKSMSSETKFKSKNKDQKIIIIIINS